jgi:hypothetical protein
VLDEPQAWRTRIDRNVVANFDRRSPFIKADKWSTHLHEAIWAGSLRFIHPHDDKTPRKFCWETDVALNATLTGSASGAGEGGDGVKEGILPWRSWRPDTPPGNPDLDDATPGGVGALSGPLNPAVHRKQPGAEQLAQSRIYQGFNESRPFLHDKARWTALPADKRQKIVLMTGRFVLLTHCAVVRVSGTVSFPSLPHSSAFRSHTRTPATRRETLWRARCTFNCRR